MGKICTGVNLTYGSESQSFVQLTATQHAWLTESVDAMERGAAPTVMGPAVRRAIERRFAENFAALSDDQWAQVAERGLTAATHAGRIAAELADLDRSPEIRRRHALAGLQVVRSICDRSTSLARLSERREPLVGAGQHHELVRVAS
jgi:hypothetical protein